MSNQYKTWEDFGNDPLGFDAYCFAVFAHRLNSRVDIELAQKTITAFLYRSMDLGEEPEVDWYVQLAEDLIRAGSPSIRDH